MERRMVEKLVVMMVKVVAGQGKARGCWACWTFAVGWKWRRKKGKKMKERERKVGVYIKKFGDITSLPSH